jgi:hypothetical protein
MPHVSRGERTSLLPDSAPARVRHGAADRGAAVKRFGYALDPLCVFACGLYVLNRFWFTRHAGGSFLGGQFNDLLLIPAALPFVLWLQRRFGLRRDDQPPRWREIALHLFAWSVAAELLAPHVFTRATGDWRDVAAYTLGGAIAGCWWQGLPWL